MSPKTKKTYQQKLAWLRKNNIVLKKEKLRPSTVNRLYSFYQRNPLSTPRNLAYGMGKRVEHIIEEYGEKGSIRTPKGQMAVKKYIKSKSRRSAKRVKHELSTNITWVKFDQSFKSGKREDRFRYVLKGGQGIIITALNVNSVLNELQRTYIPELMQNIQIFYKRRGYFYKNRAIGALIIYDTENMPDDPVPRPVKFTDDKEFPQYLWDMLHELLITDILRHYKDAIIKLICIDVFIRTSEKPTAVEVLL